MHATPCLVVRTPGRLSTVQDEGRWGWQHLGVPVGGPMDSGSFLRANVLASNPASAAALEMTLEGPTLELVGPVSFVLTGAQADARLDDVPIERERVYTVASRSLLQIGALRNGARAYLGVSGGLATTVVLGSRATTPGTLGGRLLRTDDVLPVGATRTVASRAVRYRPSADRPVTSPDGTVLRILPGPDVTEIGGRDAHAARRALETICTGPYVLGAQSNRMGYRLQGPSVPLTARSPFSAGTVMGMLQIPPDGQPILLMADRQTTGGYPVVGVVISADLPAAGQLAPGDRCRFEVCTRQDAMAALIAREQAVLGG